MADEKSGSARELYLVQNAISRFCLQIKRFGFMYLYWWREV